MELLKVEHADFTLSIECAKYGDVWARAKQHVGEENLTSTYSWTEGVKSVKKSAEDGGEVEIAPHDRHAPAVFFDQTDYPIWVEFRCGVTNARYASLLQSENDHFSSSSSYSPRLLASSPSPQA